MNSALIRRADLRYTAFYDHFKALLNDDDDDVNDRSNYEINREDNSPILNGPIIVYEVEVCIKVKVKLGAYAKAM